MIASNFSFSFPDRIDLLSRLFGSKPYCSSSHRVHPSSIEGAHGLERATRGAWSFSRLAGEDPSAIHETPVSPAMFAAARAAAASRTIVPAGSFVSPAVEGARAIETDPWPRRAALTTLKFSGP